MSAFADQCIISVFIVNVKDSQGKILLFQPQIFKNWGKKEEEPPHIVVAGKGRPDWDAP